MRARDGTDDRPQPISMTLLVSAIVGAIVAGCGIVAIPAGDPTLCVLGVFLVPFLSSAIGPIPSIAVALIGGLAIALMSTRRREPFVIGTVLLFVDCAVLVTVGWMSVPWLDGLVI